MNGPIWTEQMPKRKALDEIVGIKVYLPQSLLVRVEAELFDPVLRKPAYGARSEVIRELLRKWLEERQQEKIYGSHPS